MIQGTPINDDSIAQALDPTSPMSITSTLYWGCECEYPTTHVHNWTMMMCEECGTLRDNSPDSGLDEIRNAGIHIDWTHPRFRGTLQLRKELSRQV